MTLEEAADPTSPSESSRVSADALSAATKNMARASAHVAAIGGVAPLVSELVWAADGLSRWAWPNSAVLRRAPAGDELASLSERLDDYYGRAGGPYLLWSAWPASALERHCFTRLARPRCMSRPAGPAPFAAPAELSIVEVTRERELRSFERALIEGYPIEALLASPSSQIFDAGVLDSGAMRAWVGIADERAVSCAFGYSDERWIGIYGVATVPEWRGRGFATALVASALSGEPERSAVVLSTRRAVSLYERLGFRHEGRFWLWAKRRAR